jgi:hypothetical protein
LDCGADSGIRVNFVENSIFTQISEIQENEESKNFCRDSGTVNADVQSSDFQRLHKFFNYKGRIG